MIALARLEPVFSPRRPHALALSVALHMCLMVAWMFAPGPKLHDLGAGALQVQLVVEPPPPEPEPEPKPQAEPQPPPPVPPPPQPQPQPKPQPPKPAPVKPTPVKPAPAAPAQPATAASPAVQESAAAEPAADSRPVMSEATPQAGTVSSPSAAIAIGAPNARSAERDDYMRIVWSRIMRYRPTRVQVTGTTRLRFTLAADGELVSLEVAESSGSGMLDRAALDAVRRAAPFPAPPAGLATSALHNFEIPFQFRLAN